MAEGGSIKRCAPGKRIHGTLYLCIDALEGLPDDVRQTIARAEALLPERASWNVLKLDDACPERVSLLLYQPFDEEPFPALLESRTVDLARGSVTSRSFEHSANPPILHRKELLLAIDDPRRPAFAALTRALEQRGVFSEMGRMGFRAAWSRRLADAGIRIVNHCIETARSPNEAEIGSAAAPPSPSGIARHRTAIARARLSAPMQALLRQSLVDEGTTILDYGCGRGDDVQALEAAGFPARGWDPHHAPDASRTPSSVVNLGYVINVIEDPDERIEVLREAWSLAQDVLAVAVLVEGRADVSAQTPYRDGYLTRWSTFQKYFRQGEFLDLLAQALGRDPVPIAPGLAFVFRSDAAEQAFLAARQRRGPASPLAERALAAPARSRASGMVPLEIEARRPLLERLWNLALTLGREPTKDEVDPPLASAIVSAAGSIRRAFGACRSLFDEADLDRARERRTDDLRVYVAMTLFKQRRYGALPPDLQRDIKAFFGGLSNARAQATALLYSMAKPGALDEACLRAEAEGTGIMDGTALHLLAEHLAELPPVLRCFVGCAGWLYGDPSAAHVVEIDPTRRRVVLSRYVNFEASPAPEIEELAKIDLARQTVRIWAPSGNEDAPVLLLKGRLMNPWDPRQAEQQAFDEKVAALGLPGGRRRDVTTATLRSHALL